LQVVRVCGEADALQLQYPRSVAVDRALGQILVADQCNNRILVADDDLTGRLVNQSSNQSVNQSFFA